jgi:hypothetical protein
MWLWVLDTFEVPVASPVRRTRMLKTRMGLLLLTLTLLLQARQALSWDTPLYLDEWSAPEPYAIACGGLDLAFVANAGMNRVKKFSSDGTLLSQWASIGCRSIAVDSQGYVYVTDVAFGRINKFSADGALLDMWSLPGDPGAIAIDEEDRVFVVSRATNEILAFTTSGVLVRRWGSAGVSPGQFYVPTGIACHQGKVYVFDTVNGRIQVFRSDGTFDHLWYLSWFKWRFGCRHSR